MSNRDIFSKHLPNVKLATRYDADGKEIQVERREDVDATAREQETFDILVAAGYYRAKIKGLSAFDKVVGGMTWCIECCDYDVDVDLLFHENLTIGQKIALVEKIVSVLPKMKCPFLIEPHQIQGLEFLAIHPVIQWLVKKSVENRAERSQRLKNFAIGQFHNHYQYKTDKEHLQKIRNASTHIKRIQELYSSCRQYKRKDAASEDERTRVRMTLLEYGNKAAAGAVSSAPTADTHSDNVEREIDVDQLLKNLYIAKEHETTVRAPPKLLDPAARSALHKHYTDFKEEMETDTKALSAQSQLKILAATKAALEKKLQRNRSENEELSLELQRQQQLLQQEQKSEQQLQQQLQEYLQQEKQAQPDLLNKVQSLLQQHDELKKQETVFKEHCRQDMAQLQQQVDELEQLNAQDPVQQAAAMAQQQARLQELKLKLAKHNRAIVATQRKLDNIPDRNELAQYQRRFHELYNEMSAKHLETKQYYTLYNTLNDKKRYLEKELSLLNSICDAYGVGMQSAAGREDFLLQFEAIVSGVQQTRAKVQRKHNEERTKRDALNEQLQALLELQRLYAVAVKQLTKECQRCEQLQQHLKSIQR